MLEWKINSAALSNKNLPKTVTFGWTAEDVKYTKL